jgi:putative oxidoreductase
LLDQRHGSTSDSSDEVLGTIIAAEFVGSIALILGTFSRISAFGIVVNMLVASVIVHASNGFFMNWFGNQKGEGFEYHLLAIGLAVVVILSGAGKWSIDGLLCRRLVVQSVTAKRESAPV